MNRLETTMDISAANAKHPIHLRRFLEADDGNFSHDFFGIIRYIDRDTGELTDCFSPRFSVRANETVVYD